MRNKRQLAAGVLAAGLAGVLAAGCGSSGAEATAPGISEEGGALFQIGEGVDAETASTSRRPGEIVPGRYIIILKENIAPNEVARGHGMKPDQVFLGPNGFAGPASAGQARALEGDPRVRLVQPDRVVTLIEPFARDPKPAAAAAAETLPTGINRVDGELASVPTNLNPSGSAADPTIVVLDTGIAPHSELNVVARGTVFPGQYYDDNGHGTHVAGIAAARVNGVGVRGIAPNARLISLKVLNSSATGLVSQIIAGINWATRNVNTYNVRVVNMSLGFLGYDAAMDLYIQQSIDAGVTYTVAAGNSNRDASGFCPANITRTIAASAVADYDGACGGLAPLPSLNYGPDDTLATFSNWGATVDMGAPGTRIYSTYLNGGYARMSGTSMASPHLAGAALQYIARYRSRYGSYPSPAAVDAALKSTAWPQSSSCGFGHRGVAGGEPVLNVPGLLSSVQ